MGSVTTSHQGPVSIKRLSYLRMAISMLKIRRPLGRLIFNMGIAIPGKTVFLIETPPCLLLMVLRPLAKQIFLISFSQSKPDHSYISRSSWTKLKSYGFNGCKVSIVYSLYTKVKSAVMNNGVFCQLFEYIQVQSNKRKLPFNDSWWPMNGIFHV